MRTSYRRDLVRLRAAVALTASLAAGCNLMGYEEIQAALAVDAATTPDGFDGSGTIIGDASMDGTDADAVNGSDGAVEAGPGDAGDGWGADAGDGRVSDADAAVCFGDNVCGGCLPLPDQLDVICGLCGQGHNVCDGREALACEGGDRLPASTVAGFLQIDDFEDGDKNVMSNEGMSGSWFGVTDGTAGTLAAPVTNGAALPVKTAGHNGSAYAMHLKGSGFTSWGAGVAATVNAYGCGFDASIHGGLKFYAKGSGRLLASIATKATTPVAQHGTCTVGCNDHFNSVVTLTNTWAEYRAAFTDVKQTGWGTQVSFDPKQILSVQFSFGPNTTFDVYVDDVYFF